MKESANNFKSPIGRARGLGSAKHGLSHWWYQRVTAVALLVLLPWFVYSLLTALYMSDVLKVSEWFASPFNALFMVALLLATFWHAKLGLQVVIEDYVKCPYSKYALLLANNFFTIALFLLSVFAVFRLHMVEFAAVAP